MKQLFDGVSGIVSSDDGLQEILTFVDDLIDRVPTRLLFTLFILAFTTFLVVEASQYRGGASFFPLVVGIPLSIGLLVLCSIYLFENYRSRGEPTDETTEAGDAVAPSNLRVLRSLGWLGVLIATVLLFGFEVGTLLYLLAYYLTVSSWKKALALSIPAWLTIIAVFTFLLSVPFPDGMLGISLF